MGAKNKRKGPDPDSLDPYLSTCGDFPFKECIHALEHLGHSSLAEELHSKAQIASLKPK
jgi:hypothetical protein